MRWQYSAARAVDLKKSRQNVGGGTSVKRRANAPTYYNNFANREKHRKHVLIQKVFFQLFSQGDTVFKSRCCHRLSTWPVPISNTNFSCTHMIIFFSADWGATNVVITSRFFWVSAWVITPSLSLKCYLPNWWVLWVVRFRVITHVGDAPLPFIGDIIDLPGEERGFKCSEPD